MFIDDLNFINTKLSAFGNINKSDIIKNLINDDFNSYQKKLMFDGENYYNAIHDSLNKNFNSSKISETKIINGVETNISKSFTNPNRSNHHNVNPFHKILVDQKVSYILGKEPSIFVKGANSNPDLKNFENIISNAIDEDFIELLQDAVRGASNKGFEVIHVYYDDLGNLKFCVIPATEIIPIYDSKFQNNLVELIRYYSINVFKNGKHSIQRKVEWWTPNDVTYFTEVDNNVFLPDNKPLSHWVDINLTNGLEDNRVEHSWGRIPFIILDNNKSRTTDLQPIKGLIDAYDLISSEGTNNFLDLVDLYWVIQGYGGETSNAIAQKLKINKAVSISDSNGSVEAKQVSLPIKERIEFLKLLKHDIYHFGMGVDISIDNNNSNGIFGNSASGVALKFRYANLKHKAENITPKLKKVIKSLLWFFTQDLNSKLNTNFDPSLIRVDINYSQISDDVELVDIINKSIGLISDKTLIAKHPLVSDVNDELQFK